MKQLILMRHAKSDWTVGQRDHARPLNARGRQSAAALGDWLRKEAILPSRALVSDSARTRETWEGLALQSEVTFLKDLYLASPAALSRAIQQFWEEPTLMLIAHNPGMEALVLALSEHAEKAAQPPNPEKPFPTGATAVFELKSDSGGGLTEGNLTLRHFTTPRQILG